MMPDGTESRRNTRRIIAVVACVLLLLVGLILQGIHSRTAGSNQHLQHFAGVIGHGQPTYDEVKYDLYVRASQALKSGDARSAETLYKELIAKYPNDPEAFDALGACLVFQNRFAEARTNYLHALDLNSESERTLYGLGCVAYYENRYSEAKDYLEKSLVVNEQSGLCHRMLGIVDEELGDNRSALLHYERANALDPSDAVVKERLQELKR
jgi:tetratricopeptide (TPR) repeat protein